MSGEGDDLRLIFQDLRYWGGVLGGHIKRIGNVIWRFVKNLFAPAVAAIQDLFDRLDFSSMPRHLRQAVNLSMSLISALLNAIYQVLTGNAEYAFLPLKEALKNIMAFMLLMWRNYLSNVADWGYGLVVQIARGIVQAARSVLSTAMRYVGQIIGLFIKPGSPPKKGPLSQIAEWGRGVMETFVQSFKTADFGLLREAMSPIREAFESAVQAGDIGEQDYLRSFGQAREQVAQLI